MKSSENLSPTLSLDKERGTQEANKRNSAALTGKGGKDGNA
jgi:hypothetical protein